MRAYETYLTNTKNETEPQGRWLRTDELKEALIYLKELPYFIDKARTEHHYWKWVIISIHGLLHCLMISTLKGSNGLLTYKDNVAAAWLDAYRQKKKYKFPRNPIDSFPNLYEKIKSKRSQFYVSSKILISTREQDNSVDLLNSIRNDFIHFSPHSWNIEVSGMPKICLDCLSVAIFLAWQSGNILWRNEDTMSSAKLLFDKIISMLNVIKTEFELI